LTCVDQYGIVFAWVMKKHRNPDRVTVGQR
jgi:hypothetical protein